MKTERKVYKDAKKLLENDGWIQGAMEYKGEYCLVGAIYKSATGDIKTAKTISGQQQLLKPIAVCLDEKPHGSNITTWNDAGHRRKHEVIKALECAIKKARWWKFYKQES